MASDSVVKVQLFPTSLQQQAAGQFVRLVLVRQPVSRQVSRRSRPHVSPALPPILGDDDEGASTGGSASRLVAGASDAELTTPDDTPSGSSGHRRSFTQGIGDLLSMLGIHAKTRKPSACKTGAENNGPSSALSDSGRSPTNLSC